MKDTPRYTIRAYCYFLVSWLICGSDCGGDCGCDCGLVLYLLIRGGWVIGLDIGVNIYIFYWVFRRVWFDSAIIFFFGRDHDLLFMV